ncbi:MAG: GNAT family N-acetyltransferase [Spirochaetia bacterium]|nr:GNAT family N-acetyltransferase [Spirochaetia bacterium]
MIRQSDVAALYKAACRSRKELVEWMQWPRTFSINMAGKHVAKRLRSWSSRELIYTSLLGFAIRCRGEFVGAMDLSNFSLPEGSAEVSYWIDTSQARQRIARRALHMLTTFCFQHEIPRVILCVDPRNVGSQNVVRRVGGIRIGASISI